MFGLMQEWPLLCHKIIDHAANFHGDREVVSRSCEGPIHRTTYKEVNLRARKVSQALLKHGLKLGDRVATLAWNNWRHFEAWYGMLGAGVVYHTVNPRLFPEQIVYLINHAQDRLIFVDLTFVPIIEGIIEQVPTLEKVIILTDDEHMPETSLKNAVAYESWIGEQDGDYEWAKFDENTAAGMCYTSGTTGNPKGVLYSHRSNVLHALACLAPDMLGLSSRDVIMPVVPLFHANGWSTAFTSPMGGAKLVLPGGKMDGESIYEMLDNEKVTITAAVPTVWLMLLNYLETSGKKLPHLQRVVIGGAACPRFMTEKFEQVYDVDVIHAWGMTEMSPLGTLGSLKPAYAELKGDARLDIKEKQGHPPFTVEMKIVNDDEEEQPWDGKTFGKLRVAGPAVAASYYKGEGGDIIDAEGFFDTGDVAHIDEQGYMQITDRSKDVIKSGGEWISSIDIENMACGHPKVMESAVIGVAHPKWDERPLLVVVMNEGETLDKQEILDFLVGKIAKWWMPDDVVEVDEIPHTSTGKIQKTELRSQFKDYKLPTA